VTSEGKFKASVSLVEDHCSFQLSWTALPTLPAAHNSQRDRILRPPAHRAYKNDEGPLTQFFAATNPKLRPATAPMETTEARCAKQHSEITLVRGWRILPLIRERAKRLLCGFRLPIATKLMGPLVDSNYRAGEEQLLRIV
jgi:hypothetical protein